MNLSKLKKYLLLISCSTLFIFCNKYNKNTTAVSDTGNKNPTHHQPTHGKDTVKIKTSEESSKNHEYDQHRIDSIKNSKTKPPIRKKGKGD